MPRSFPYRRFPAYPGTRLPNACDLTDSARFVAHLSLSLSLVLVVRAWGWIVSQHLLVVLECSVPSSAHGFRPGESAQIVMAI